MAILPNASIYKVSPYKKRTFRIGKGVEDEVPNWNEESKEERKSFRLSTARRRRDSKANSFRCITFR